MNEWNIGSPSGRIAMDVRHDPGAGTLEYRVRHHGQDVIDWSPLGLTTGDADLSHGLGLVDAGQAEEGDRSFDAIHGKSSGATVPSVERTFRFSVDSFGLGLDVVLTDEGAAFRYHLDGGDGEPTTVTNEVTAFGIVSPATAWVQPTQTAGYHAPAYENFYSNGVAAESDAPGPSWNMPALFQVGSSWLLLAESDLSSTYFGGRLSNRDTGSTYRLVMPQPTEGVSSESVEPTNRLPLTTPWRVMIIGESPSAVADSELVTALASPPTGDFSWVKPGRVTWSWWSENESPRHLDRLYDYVDLAAELGFEYTLVDANWNVHSDQDLTKFVSYAAAKDVGVLFWYNSGGPNNKVTEQPRDRMYDPQIRAAEMQRLVALGAAGIKVDFFQSDKQSTIDLYLAITRDAAAHHLLVDFHGSTVPRGWSRTWPNLMTMEGVRGAEQYGFDPDYPEHAAWHNTVLAYTRNVVGPMDYTPVTFSDNTYPHLTTNAHELALAVIFESGLQHYADSAASYRSLPEDVKALMMSIPAAWDETLFLDGFPGDYVVVARRSGDTWFLAGINGLDEEWTVQIESDELTDRTSVIVTDTEDPRVMATRTFEASGPIEVTMAPRGGFVIRIDG